MTTLNTHASRHTHPGGFDSIDFYTQNGHRLHARAAREGVAVIWQMLRDLIRR
ncbi:MAG: hypothetical protein R3349_00380 [Geminicoccaceae bacterium]|nr:hypothetical protein [Geminicoccaceae bacterium]